MRGLLLAITVCGVLSIAACGGGDGSSSSASSEATSESSAPQTGEATGEGSAPQAGEESTATKPKIEITEEPWPTKLEVKELVKGDGAEAKAGDRVTVQYVGVNYKTGEEFDSSWDRGEPFAFTLGGGEVIKGWDRGVAGMKVGGRRELTIPPQLGYGSAGAPPAIPPNEILVFVIDLLAVE